MPRIPPLVRSFERLHRHNPIGFQNIKLALFCICVLFVGVNMFGTSLVCEQIRTIDRTIDPLGHWQGEIDEQLDVLTFSEVEDLKHFLRNALWLMLYSLLVAVIGWISLINDYLQLSLIYWLLLFVHNLAIFEALKCLTPADKCKIFTFKAYLTIEIGPHMATLINVGLLMYLFMVTVFIVDLVTVRVGLYYDEVNRRQRAVRRQSAG